MLGMWRAGRRKGKQEVGHGCSCRGAWQPANPNREMNRRQSMAQRRIRRLTDNATLNNHRKQLSEGYLPESCLSSPTTRRRLHRIYHKSTDAARLAVFNSPVFATAVVHALLQPQTPLLTRRSGYALFANAACSIKKELFELPNVTEALEQGLGYGDAIIVKSCAMILGLHGTGETFKYGCSTLHSLIDTDTKAEELLLAHHTPPSPSPLLLRTRGQEHARIPPPASCPASPSPSNCTPPASTSRICSAATKSASRRSSFFRPK